jgi:hypothetical protein
MDKEVIEAFLQEMRQRHGREIEAIALPEGTADYLLERAQADDVETLTFMLKLSYLMGLQTGYAVQAAEETPTAPPKGPLQA